MSRVSHCAPLVTLLCFALLFGVVTNAPLLTAQEPATTAKPKPQGRLPKFYSQVISGLQKEEIYKIQDSYASKIESLEAQLTAMKRERDAKVAAVLSPEQKQRVLEYEQAELNERQQELKSTTSTPKSTEPAPEAKEK